jgi:hypothetical protein
MANRREHCINVAYLPAWLVIFRLGLIFVRASDGTCAGWIAGDLGRDSREGTDDEWKQFQDTAYEYVEQNIANYWEESIRMGDEIPVPPPQ